jgi:hypothetical protein
VTIRQPSRNAPRNNFVGLIAIALVLAGLWYLRSREESPKIDLPSSTGASASSSSGASAPSAPATPKRERAPTPGAERGGSRRTPGPVGADSASPALDERYDLDADEARGGHTIARHVERSDAQLRQRLAQESGIGTASTYTSQAIAERTIARTLRANADRVEDWTSRRGNRPNLALDYRGRRDEVLGRSIRRGRAPVDCYDAVVVLRWDGRGSYVLTSYPEASR